ncbi:hypothetical protein QZH46_23365 [Pseudomonas corrugata]
MLHEQQTTVAEGQYRQIIRVLENDFAGLRRDPPDACHRHRLVKALALEYLGIHHDAGLFKSWPLYLGRAKSLDVVALANFVLIAVVRTVVAALDPTTPQAALGIGVDELQIGAVEPIGAVFEHVLLGGRPRVVVNQEAQPLLIVLLGNSGPTVVVVAVMDVGGAGIVVYFLQPVHLAAPGRFARGFPLSDASLFRLDQACCEVLLALPVPGKCLALLGRDHDRAVIIAAGVQVPQVIAAFGQGVRQRLEADLGHFVGEFIQQRLEWLADEHVDIGVVMLEQPKEFATRCFPVDMHPRIKTRLHHACLP